MTHRPTLLALSSLALLALASCGGVERPRTTSPADLRVLSEGRVLEIVAEVLGEAGVQASADWPVDIGAGRPLEVDVRLATGPYGIEWVTAQDREDYGAAIPGPDPTGQLRILPGAGSDERVQIVVLHEGMYRFDPDLERVQRGATGVRDVEGRLRRDLNDFLEYVRGQGGP